MNDLDQLNVQHDRIVYILPLTWVPQQNNAHTELFLGCMTTV